MELLKTTLVIKTEQSNEKTHFSIGSRRNSFLTAPVYLFYHCEEGNDEAISFLYLFFCLEAKEPKIQDLETPAKNNLYSLKILKLARIQYLFFGSEFVMRFE